MELKSIDNALTKIGFGKFHLIMLVFSGLANAYCSMKVISLTLLGPILICEWTITVLEMFFLQSSYFLGILIGGVILWKLSDIYGRKTVLLISVYGASFIGILTAFVPTIHWMIIMQLTTGILIGGIRSCIAPLMIDLTPKKFIGSTLVLFEVFWSLGSYCITVIAFLTIKIYTWRMFLIFAQIPIVLVSVFLLWMPESPVFLMVINKKLSSLKVINQIAKMNKSEFIHDIYEKPITKITIQDLINRSYLSTTLLTGLMFFISCLNYFSIIFLVTLITGIPHNCMQDIFTLSSIPIDNRNNTVDDSCCFELNWSIYETMLISTTGEIIFIPVTLILVRFVGRKNTFAIYSVIISIGITFLNFCLSSTSLNILLFFIRGAANAYLNLIYVYVSETFPTSIRSLGLGIGNLCSRIGVIASAFIVNLIILKISLLTGTSIILILNVFVLIWSILLPHEMEYPKSNEYLDETDSVTEQIPKNKFRNYKSVTNK